MDKVIRESGRSGLKSGVHSGLIIAGCVVGAITALACIVLIWDSGDWGKRSQSMKILASGVAALASFSAVLLLFSGAARLAGAMVAWLSGAKPANVSPSVPELKEPRYSAPELDERSGSSNRVVDRSDTADGLQGGTHVAPPLSFVRQRHPMPLAGGTRLGEYTVAAVLRFGPDGITYKAVKPPSKREVAIQEYFPPQLAIRDHDGLRVLPTSECAPEAFAEGLKRFGQEAMLLTRIKHANILPVLWYFEANSTAYIVTELLDGDSIASALERQREIAEVQSLELLSPVLSGVEELHRFGILHRNIRPENILIRRDGSPVLVGFGAAEQTPGGAAGLPLTEGYAPLEQYLSNGSLGPWTDIYALGALAYHCLSGERPASAPQRLAALMKTELDPLASGVSKLRKRISPTLASAIERALALQAQGRPRSIGELRALIWPDRK